MKNNTILFNQLRMLTTEQINPRSKNIDTMNVAEILALINREDASVASAVRKELSSITWAVEVVVKAFKKGGRLIYVGAGTSGRLGILDAAECPPTYGTDPQMVQGIIAGGKQAVFKSQEGVEDKADKGVSEIRRLGVSGTDVVCGIAASFRTPFVVGAIKEAKRRRAKTIFITTNPRSILELSGFAEIRRAINIAICVQVGPEIIMGSTRMKAGTAQKMVLNMITTTAMIKLGKVYGNLMVDLRMNSKKLHERAKRIIMLATSVDYATANKILSKAGGQAKTAIVMSQSGVSAVEARRRLKRAKGFVRSALKKGIRN
jgi:N-acetylmuramic acid 6-phosphate etherase